MLILTIVTKREKWAGPDNVDTYDITDILAKSYKPDKVVILCDLDNLGDMDFSCISRNAYIMDTSDLSVEWIATAKTDDPDHMDYWYWEDIR